MREPKSYEQMVEDWHAGVGESTYETDRMKRELAGLPTEPPTTVYPPPNIVPVGRILTAAEHAAIWRNVEENMLSAARSLQSDPRAHNVYFDYARMANYAAAAYEAAAKEERG